jgi:hypothetical protein
LAEISPVKDANGLVTLPEGDEVNCVTNGSGVGLADCADKDEYAPETSKSRARAQTEPKTCFTKILRNKDADTSRLDALGERAAARAGGMN